MTTLHIYMVGLFLLFLILPNYISKLTNGLKVNDWLSDIVVCYIIGILIGNSKQFWLAGDIFLLEQIDDPQNPQAKPLLKFFETIAGFSVLLSIPMLLMTTSVKEMLRNIRPVLLSYALAAISVCIACAFAAWWYLGTLADGNVVASMLTGVYIGGTPNLLAIGKGLNVNTETLAILQATDAFCCGIYVLFLTSVAQKVLNTFLPAYQSKAHLAAQEESLAAQVEERLSISERIKSVGTSILVTSGIIAISMFLGLQTSTDIVPPKAPNQIVLMTVLTTLSISVSFITHIRTLKGVQDAAQYILLIFALAAGSMADFGTVIEKGGDYLGFNATVLVIIFALHWSLCKLFRIDTDTCLMGSTASVFGPGFIPPLSKVLKNKELLSAGVAAGVLGLIIANYIGFGMALLLKIWY
jgi:uncharacterized membrane protein